MAQPLHTQSSRSNVGAIPLQDLRNAIHPVRSNDLAVIPGPSRPSSRMHDFVATDNGIATGFAPKPGPRTWEHSRSSAVSITKSSKVTQGLLLPCVTYGKAQFELDQAKKGRAGYVDPAHFRACNSSCLAYAAVCTILPCMSGV